MPRLAVIIVSWNTEQLTYDCLQSLYTDIKNLDHEVWVVDNNSSDDSVAMIKSKFPQVKLIENEDNVGFARANNQALKKVEADYYLLLNSDTVVPEGALTGMVQYLEDNKTVDSVGPKLTNRKKVQHSFTKLPSLGGELKYCLVYHFFPFGRFFKALFFKPDEYFERLDRPLQVEVLSAACLLFRKEVIEKIGYLAEDYFLFSEENDFFTRMKQAGLKSVYLPTIEVIHLIGASREKRIKIDSEKNFIRSRMLYFSKFYPGGLNIFKMIYYIFFGWSYVLSSISRLLNGNDEYVVLYSTLLRTLGGKK